MSKSHTLARERRIREGAWRGKSALHNEGRQVLRGERGQVRASLGEVEARVGDWTQKHLERSEESWFHS